MNHNNIQGSIPSKFESLSQIRFFDVRHNQITGTIPDWMGNAWKNLGELALSFNNMTGPLPESLRNLTSIKTLTLAHNSLNSDLASIQGLMTLEFLYLEGNQFRGTLDGTFLARMPNLVQVDMSSNQLDGQGLPLHLLQHPTLKVLDLCDNKINGTLPRLTSKNPVLQYLSLCNNALSGSLPKTISKLNKLTHLDMANNDLTGEIPSSLGDHAVLDLSVPLPECLRQGSDPRLFVRNGPLARVESFRDAPHGSSSRGVVGLVGSIGPLGSVPQRIDRNAAVTAVEITTFGVSFP